MPVYEFYCSDCHRIFNFLARRANTRKKPECPKCGKKKLERKLSLFAVSRNLEEKDDDLFPDCDIDEARMERIMEDLAREADGVDEDDPRQAGRLMRKLFDATGVDPGSAMNEAIRRMESGEDPDQVEADMGDILEQEDPFAGSKKKGGKMNLKNLRRKFLPPSMDETLYDL